MDKEKKTKEDKSSEDKVKSKDSEVELQNEKTKQSEENQPPPVKQSKKGSAIRWVTGLVLLLCIVFFVWHIFADRFVPYTDQARIKGIVIPIVPQVSGYLTDVNVRLHSVVPVDSTLFQLDQRPFELALRAARAEIDQAIQDMGARDATVKSAVGRLGVARAQLDRAQRNYERVQQVMEENPGALSLADRDRAETALAQATEHLSSAEADLEKAQQELGVIGPKNPNLRSAIINLEKAELDLIFTTILAPDEGFIESFNVEVGYYSQAGQPIATFVSSKNVWLQADMRENNISNMKIGDRAEFVLDIAPGRIFEGKVRSIGYGISTGDTNNRGDLPSISGSKGWLREPQRFPVIIGFDDPAILELSRIGGQADVIVYSDHPYKILETIGHWQIKINSWLSYVR